MRYEFVAIIAFDATGLTSQVLLPMTMSGRQQCLDDSMRLRRAQRGLAGHFE